MSYTSNSYSNWWYSYDFFNSSFTLIDHTAQSLKLILHYNICHIFKLSYHSNRLYNLFYPFWTQTQNGHIFLNQSPFYFVVMILIPPALSPTSCEQKNDPNIKKWTLYILYKRVCTYFMIIFLPLPALYPHICTHTHKFYPKLNQNNPHLLYHMYIFIQMITFKM